MNDYKVIVQYKEVETTIWRASSPESALTDALEDFMRDRPPEKRENITDVEIRLMPDED